MKAESSDHLAHPHCKRYDRESFRQKKMIPDGNRESTKRNAKTLEIVITWIIQKLP